MISQLGELDATKEIDHLERHLLAQINKMNFKKVKTNDMLNQLIENQTIIIKVLINEMRYNQNR